MDFHGTLGFFAISSSSPAKSNCSLSHNQHLQDAIDYVHQHRWNDAPLYLSVIFNASRLKHIHIMQAHLFCLVQQVHAHEHHVHDQEYASFQFLFVL